MYYVLSNPGLRMPSACSNATTTQRLLPPRTWFPPSLVSSFPTFSSPQSDLPWVLSGMSVTITTALIPHLFFLWLYGSLVTSIDLRHALRRRSSTK